jgi:hypothetical protein
VRQAQAADVVARAQAVLSESELLRAMFDVGYFPPNTPPDKSLLDNATLLPACRKPLLTPASYPDTIDIRAGGRMEHKQFIVRAFEREPGKWRAKILRPTGKPLVTDRKRTVQYISGVDRATASAALLAALEAIDAGAFARPATLTEKFWHRRGSNTPARIVPQAKRGARHNIGRTRFGRARTAEQSIKQPRS